MSKLTELHEQAEEAKRLRTEAAISVAHIAEIAVHYLPDDWHMKAEFEKRVKDYSAKNEGFYDAVEDWYKGAKE